MIYRFVNHKSNCLKNANDLSQFVDYTSITCRFSIPIRLPNVIYVNLTAFNRDNNNSLTTTTSIKNLTLPQIHQLIQYYKQFYDEPMLPINSTIISSPTTNDDLVIVQNSEDEPINQNIVVLDEKLL